MNQYNMKCVVKRGRYSNCNVCDFSSLMVSLSFVSHADVRRHAVIRYCNATKTIHACAKRYPDGVFLRYRCAVHLLMIDKLIWRCTVVSYMVCKRMCWRVDWDVYRYQSAVHQSLPARRVLRDVAAKSTRHYQVVYCLQEPPCRYRYHDVITCCLRSPPRLEFHIVILSHMFCCLHFYRKDVFCCSELFPTLFLLFLVLYFVKGPWLFFVRSYVSES